MPFQGQKVCLPLTSKNSIRSESGGKYWLPSTTMVLPLRASTAPCHRAWYSITLP
jgi:hypothetical protein